MSFELATHIYGSLKSNWMVLCRSAIIDDMSDFALSQWTFFVAALQVEGKDTIVGAVGLKGISGKEVQIDRLAVVPHLRSQNSRYCSSLPL